MISLPAIVATTVRSRAAAPVKRCGVIGAPDDNGYQINQDRRWHGDGQAMYGDLDDKRKIWCGMSFASFRLPTNAAVHSATLCVEVEGTSAGKADLVSLYAEKRINAFKPEQGNGPCQWDGRRTNNSVVIVFETAGVKEIDITAIVKEIIAQPSWTAGMRLNLYFKPISFGGNRTTTFVDQQAYIEVIRL
jgi:hypothetical protein